MTFKIIGHLIEVLQDAVDGFEGQADPSRLLVAPAQAHISRDGEGCRGSATQHADGTQACNSNSSNAEAISTSALALMAQQPPFHPYEFLL